MATASGFQAAETYLISYQGNADLVTVARRRALDLRAEAGEATLKLSERAADSADAVLKAASVIQSLGESLHEVSSDLKDAKLQLQGLLALVDKSSGILEKASSTTRKEDGEPPVMKRTMSQREHVTDKITSFFDQKKASVKRKLGNAAYSSQDFLTSLGSVAEVLREEFDKCCKESLAQGWIGRFPKWSSQIMSWFVEKMFFPEILLAAWSGVNNTKGEMLTEDQWRRLGVALQEILSKLGDYRYLFVAKAEGSLQYMTASLLQRSRQDIINQPQKTSFTDLNHPLRRSLQRIMYLLTSNRLITESLAPIVLIRCSIFLQEMDQQRAGEVRLAINDVLVNADLCL